MVAAVAPPLVSVHCNSFPATVSAPAVMAQPGVAVFVAVGGTAVLVALGGGGLVAVGGGSVAVRVAVGGLSVAVGERVAVGGFVLEGAGVRVAVGCGVFVGWPGAVVSVGGAVAGAVAVGTGE